MPGAMRPMAGPGNSCSIPTQTLTQALTTVAFLTKSGSNSTPRPWPVGTGITPFLIWKFGVYQDSFLAAARDTYSMYGPTLGVVAANCRMLTLAAPVWVLCGQIHMLAVRAMRATRAARMKPPL